MTAAPLSHATVMIAGSPFRAIWTPEDGVVRAGGFDTEFDPGHRFLRDRLAAGSPELASRGLEPRPDDEHPIAEALRAYAAGRLDAIDGIPVSQPETEFRGGVRRALREVAAGEHVTYTGLAERAGRPDAVRAAASACATNLIALIVPCHRILRRDGGAGGYLFGVDLKRRLLQHEGALTPSAARAQRRR
ncbi:MULTISPECIES: methylated-DNA--[protein]-cysteine S-methyltransferase [unclassified Leucobacter]|uniref:methylated-DNA--[protein]-cysteine S-methyltransferase n=1 Tax=unclassified Leucobacter TaxID=2621730 RepID=UPI0006227244|nr:methylated-DNA--[protein]-cysteine S-methyltransferase [Leucobacter sp. Ag1]KKI20694.1 cysteine methyltransferase [Leucobacter sp. Ag1]